MEGKPKPEITVEKFRASLELKLIGMSKNELLGSGLTPFSVTSEFDIYLSKKGHHFLFEKYGVDPEMTLAEGYIDYKPNGNTSVVFKKQYQKIPGFHGSPVELEALQTAVRNKIFELFN